MWVHSTPISSNVPCQPGERTGGDGYKMAACFAECVHFLFQVFLWQQSLESCLIVCSVVTTVVLSNKSQYGARTSQPGKHPGRCLVRSYMPVNIYHPNFFLDLAFPNNHNHSISFKSTRLIRSVQTFLISFPSLRPLNRPCQTSARLGSSKLRMTSRSTRAMEK